MCLSVVPQAHISYGEHHIHLLGVDFEGMIRMSHTLRPYATAGVALVGAGMVAVTPVTTPLAEPFVQRDVQLTTTDILSIPFNTLQDAFTNNGNLSLAFVDANNALVDAIQTNPDWFSALLNPQELFGALTFLAGDQKDFINPLTAWTLGVQTPDSGIGDPGFTESYAFLYGILSNQAHELQPALFPALPEPIPEIASFLASPLSGVLLGAVSPLVAPLVPFLNPFMELIADLQNGTNPDIGSLFTELLAAPLNSINGFLNGDTLDLDPLLPLVNGAGLLPEGDIISTLSLAFGGLLTPGEVGSETSLEGLTAPAVLGGGSILNALGLGLSVTSPLTITFPFIGHGVGPFGALIGLEQVIAELFSGNLDFAGDSGGTAALDLGSLFPDLSQLFSGDAFGDLGQLFDFSDLLSFL